MCPRTPINPHSCVTVQIRRPSYLIYYRYTEFHLCITFFFRRLPLLTFYLRKDFFFPSWGVSSNLKIITSRRTSVLDLCFYHNRNALFGACGILAWQCGFDYPPRKFGWGPNLTFQIYTLTTLLQSQVEVQKIMLINPHASFSLFNCSSQLGASCAVCS